MLGILFNYKQVFRSSIITNKLKMNQSETKSIHTIKELTEKLAKAMGLNLDDRSTSPSHKNLDQYAPKTQNELPARSMKDSYLEALIPLSTSTSLQNKYVKFLGQVRVGRLLEDLDIFAVLVAQKHIHIPNLPEGVPCSYILVTAHVDKIVFCDFIPKPQEDIKMSGHVSWVGRSSMEVAVCLEQKMEGTWHKITRALFMIAARDTTNTKAAVVNPLVPASDQEKQVFSGGELRRRQRATAKQQHVSKVIPDHEEQKLIHDLYMRTKNTKDFTLKNRTLPSGCAWMDACTLSNVVLSFPENRNLHNTVFGGWLMLLATELSWILGFQFIKRRPMLKSISDINFTKPIAVNSLIQMHAYVVHNHGKFFQAIVYVETIDVRSGQVDNTNIFHFTYEALEVVKDIIPTTYHEALMYIDGRRHFLDVINSSSHDDLIFQLVDANSTHKCKL